jgi:hypothetical protein
VRGIKEVSLQTSGTLPKRRPHFSCEKLQRAQEIILGNGRAKPDTVETNDTVGNVSLLSTLPFLGVEIPHVRGSGSSLNPHLKRKHFSGFT